MPDAPVPIKPPTIWGTLGRLGGSVLSVLFGLSILKDLGSLIPGLDWLSAEGRERRFRRAQEGNSLVANAMLLQGDQAREQRDAAERALARSDMLNETRLARLSQNEMAKTMMLLGMLGGQPSAMPPPTPYQPINLPGLR